MKRILIAILVLHLATVCNAQLAAGNIKAKVDPRVELMAIISRIAHMDGYTSNVFELYIKDVDAWFAKDSLHPAVLLLKKLAKEDQLAFDALMKMAIHLEYPSLKPKVKFTSLIPEPRWTKEGAEQFVPLLQRFFTDTKFDDFFAAHQSMYKECEARFQVLLDKTDYGWFTRFYGYAPEQPFSVYIGLLNGSISYGPKVEYPDGKEEFYAIMSNDQVDKQGMPVFDKGLLPTIIHEFNHSYINHLVTRDTVELKPYAQKLYQNVAGQMASNFYPSWTITLFESMVRAAVIRYTMEHDSAAVRAAIADEYGKGFYWIEDLVTMMGMYSNNRKQYKTFASFMPEIKAGLKDIAFNSTYRYDEFYNKVPRLLTSLQIKNNDSLVDPTITKLTLIFSRPMRGFSFQWGEGGKEHYPIASVEGWDESFTQLTLKLELKPGWDYEIKLIPVGFKTSDGMRLVNTSFRFHTGLR